MSLRSEDFTVELVAAMDLLKSRDYHVVKLGRKVPSAIAFKDGKFYAVQLIGKRWRKGKGWQAKVSKSQKQEEFHGIGETIFFEFKYSDKQEQ